MQSCLNKEYMHYRGCFRRRPALWLLVAIILTMAAVFTWVGVMCTTSWTCPNSMADTFLIIGINLILGIVVLFMVPCILTIVLNCLFDYTWPPDTSPPRWAFVSYAEATAKTRAKETVAIKVGRRHSVH